MRKLLQYVFALYILLFGEVLLAQQPDLLFEKITDQSGRPIRSVSGIVQDSYGFMWFSGSNGLLRYDGYDYKHFRKNVRDTTGNSLPFSNITKLYQDRDDVLWLQQFDRAVAFKDDKLMATPLSLDTIKIFNIIEDDSANLWIGPTNDGLVRYSKTNQELSFYKKPIPKFPKAIYEVLDSLDRANATLAQLVQMGNDIDTSLSFTVQEPIYVLLACAGEAEKNFDFDYGYLQQGANVIWSMSTENSRHPGGAKNNKVGIGVLVLNPGEYTLRYKTDGSNAYGSWELPQPEDVSVYGIKAFKISSADKEYVQNLLQQKMANHTIVSDDIKAFLINNKRQFCFLSPKGISIYNQTDNQFQELPIPFVEVLGVDDANDFYISSFFHDAANNYWIGTSQGLLKYTQDGQTDLYRQGPGDRQLSSDMVTAITQDRHGDLWVGTASGINILEQGSGRVFKYKADNRNGLYSNWVVMFYEDKAGSIWISTREGLNRLKRSRFTFYETNQEKFTAFPHVFDKQNRLWMQGDSNTLVVCPRNGEPIKQYAINESLFPMDPYGLGQRLFHIQALYQLKDGMLWMGIGNQFCRFNPNAERIDRVCQLPDLLLPGDTLADKALEIVSDSDGNAWFFSTRGVSKINSPSGQIDQFWPFRHKGETKEDLEEGNYIKDVLLVGNVFWVRTAKGMFSFNVSQQELKQEFVFDTEVQFSSLTEGNSCVDQNGNLWFAALPKLYHMNTATLNIDTLIIETMGDVGYSMSKIGEDGRVWIYTDNGIYGYSTLDSTVFKFTKREGLLGDIVNGLYDDGRDNIWISSEEGLTKLDKETEEVQHFFHRFDYRNLTFLGLSDQKTQSTGELVFFTSKGYVLFYPDSINRNVPPVVITSLKLRGKEFNLDSLIYQKTEIKLNYDQNDIEFAFSALDYTDPGKNQYRYTLENYHDYWTYRNASRRTANFTPPPGTYTFRVVGSNNNKVWNNDGVAVRIIIEPPYWKTWWFITLEILFLVLVVYLYIKQRERKLKVEKRVLEERVAERTHEINMQKKQIEVQRDIATRQRDQILKQKQEITDSITYASRIQSAILPPDELIDQTLGEHFILFKPRDIVSGDFYWLSSKGTKTYISAADCTGHGVPGAFMSMLGVAFLNEIVSKPEVETAGEILDHLRKYVIKSLHQTGKDNEAKDGMDISLCVIDTDALTLEFAGAYNSLILVRQNTSGEYILQQLKADRMPIGIFHKAKENFTTHTFQLQKGDTLYMHSDGYVDQFGGDKGRKFMTKRFKELLVEIQGLSMIEQQQLLEVKLAEWMNGNFEQIDDIVVVGLKI